MEVAAGGISVQGAASLDGGVSSHRVGTPILMGAGSAEVVGRRILSPGLLLVFGLGKAALVEVCTEGVASAEGDDSTVPAVAVSRMTEGLAVGFGRVSEEQPIKADREMNPNKTSMVIDSNIGDRVSLVLISRTPCLGSTLLEETILELCIGPQLTEIFTRKYLIYPSLPPIKN